MKICLIPARKGSQRIKNKNILNFDDKPLIAHSIQIAKKSNMFDKIYVSTDCKKISSIAIKYGASVPFIRPAKYAKKKSTDIEVIEHFLNFFKKKKNYFYYLCYIYATNPLLKTKTIKKSFDLLRNKKAQKVLTISKYEYPIQRALGINETGMVYFREPKYRNYISQKLKTFYQDATQLYWYDLTKIKNFDQFHKFKTFGYKLKNTEFVDLNDQDDLRKLKILYNKN